VLKTLGKITSLYKLGDVAACRIAACVLCTLQSESCHCCVWFVFVLSACLTFVKFLILVVHEPIHLCVNIILDVVCESLGLERAKRSTRVRDTRYLRNLSAIEYEKLM